MKSFTYTIRDEVGIHARPAGMLVKAMQQFVSEITLTRGDKTVNLKKLFAVMGLGVKQNHAVTISADGADEDAALAAARKVLEDEGL
jgi:phosphocarrier protein